MRRSSRPDRPQGRKRSRSPSPHPPPKHRRGSTSMPPGWREPQQPRRLPVRSPPVQTTWSRNLRWSRNQSNRCAGDCSGVAGPRSLQPRSWRRSLRPRRCHPRGRRERPGERSTPPTPRRSAAMIREPCRSPGTPTSTRIGWRSRRPDCPSGKRAIREPRTGAIPSPGSRCRCRRPPTPEPPISARPLLRAPRPVSRRRSRWSRWLVGWMSGIRPPIRWWGCRSRPGSSLR